LLAVLILGEQPSCEW